MAWADESDTTALTTFPGEAQSVDLATSPPATGARRALNVVFGLGFVATRPEFSDFFTSTLGSRIIRGMFNWVVSNGNILLFYYQQGVGDWRVRARYLTNNTEYDLTAALPGGVAGMMARHAGSRVYFALFNSSGIGADHTRIWDGNFTSGVPNVEKAFERARLTSEVSLAVAAATANPGEIPLTAGQHNIAVAFTTKNGHRLRLSPQDAGGAVVPLTFTADGSSVYILTVTPVGNWPNWLQTVEPVLTPRTNLNKFYYIPDTYSSITQVPTPNVGGDITLRFGIDDTTLSTGSSARDIADLQSILQQDAGGGAPFYPHAIAEGTDRMAYLAQTADLYLFIRHKVFVSEPSDYQYVTLDQHAFEAPGAKALNAICWIHSTLYFFGPNWTYARTDNGRTPVEWPPIVTVDESIGTSKPFGILANPTHGYVWVAHTSGLYRFAGASYPERPISWVQGAADWDSINWAADASTFCIKELPARKVVIVMAPLGAATAASHLLVWDYALGSGWDTVRYAKFSIAGWDPGAIEIGMNNTSRKMELWLSHGTVAAQIVRWATTTTDVGTRVAYGDNAPGAGNGVAGIDSQYTTPTILHRAGGVWNWIASTLRVIGAGVLGLTSEDLAGTSFPMSSITGASNPSVEYERRIDMQTEAGAIRITNGATTGAWFRLSYVRIAFQRWMSGRG